MKNHSINIIDKKLLYLFFIFCSLSLHAIRAEGLRFYGNGYPIDKRTSYDVFSEKTATFTEYYEINFDLLLYLTSEIGNIVRIKTNCDNRVFNLFYDGHDEEHLFLLNEEGKSNLISIALNKSDYPPRQWLTVHIAFDLKNDSITLTIEGHTHTHSMPLPDKSSPTIVFGKSDHIIDVPPIAIKNLSVGNSKKQTFLLNEYQGEIVHDTKGKKRGSVSNPEWLINDSYHWKTEAQFNSSTVSGSNFHEGKKELYYFNRDSLIIFNLRTRETKSILFDNICPVDLKLGTNFIDQENNRLYSYEVYHDSTYQGPTMASLDLSTFKWRIESYDRLPTQLHHHASYFDPSTHQYLIFGGFGNMRFSNQFYSYNIDSHEWSLFPINNNGGITPRYFTSLGHGEENRYLYLFGGTGNVSGDQLLGREYFYDLYRLDLQTNVIEKVWEIPWNQESAVPVRNMVINDASSFYTLCYPEHFTKSFLQLYRFSLKDGHYAILGDSIPIFSDKINTNANLYFDKDLNTLYAVVHQFDDDIQSDIHIYSLSFPPITKKELASHPPTGKKSDVWVIYLILGVVLFAGLIAILRLGWRKKDSKGLKDSQVIKDSKELFDIGSMLKITGQKLEAQSKANSIYLFGEFTVNNRNNRDITYMFTKKIKDTFCLLLQYSQEKEGISSQHLSRLLWPEKSHQEVKNIRNVTLSRLRKIFEELDGIELLYEKGIFIITQRNPVYCDYTRCIQLLSVNAHEPEYKELLEIINRGKFLENEDEPFYDSFKENTEKWIEPFIIHALLESYEKEAWQTTIDLAQAAFNIDPTNETAINCMIKAMQKLGMHEAAKIKYLSFLIEYKKNMGKDYPNPLNL